MTKGKILEAIETHERHIRESKQALAKAVEKVTVPYLYLDMPTGERGHMKFQASMTPEGKVVIELILQPSETEDYAFFATTSLVLFDDFVQSAEIMRQDLK